MVKTDAHRDYYADLELHPTADPDEVKKQFKKLGVCSDPLRLSLASWLLMSSFP